MKLLLELGAEMEARDADNQTALHLSAENNRTEAVKLLLERGVEIEARDVDNQTPLELALSNPSNEAVICLLMNHAVNTS